MSRVRTRFPTVFVGHPFGNHFATKKFRKIFDELPFKVIYGNTDVKTEHLLQIMKASISKCDFSLFDLSGWNPNVALELGLAEGLKKRALKPYYILLNSRRSSDVPADLRGLQRLEYTRYDYTKDVGIGNLLMQHILAKEFWYKRIWKKISHQPKADKIMLLCLRILAHLRDHEKLAPENLQKLKLKKGMRLRADDHSKSLEVLSELRLIKKLSQRSSVYTIRKIFFKK